MISPNTLPGTHIVCIIDTEGAFRVPNITKYRLGLQGLTKGRIYTVRGIEPTIYGINKFSVILNEIDRIALGSQKARGYDIGRFKIAVLPKSITSLLENVPIKEDA